jgi:hypothetical protein
MKRKEILQQVSESYPKHQDLSGIPTEKLKAYLAKQSQQQVSGEGNQIKRVRAELQRREQQGVSEGIEDTRREVNLKKKIDKGTATPEQKKEYEALKAKNTGKKQGVSEGFDARQRTRLNDLIDLYRDSIDPNPYTDADDPDDVILRIRQEFGDKIADQVEAGARKMHFPRDNHVMGRGDPLSWKQPVDPDRITKKGKMYKQDSDYRKNTIKSRYKLSGRSSTREDTQIESSGRQRYEEMKDKIAGVLIKLYHQGEDSESMQGFKDRVANHLGYDPEDPIYDQAWFTSLTDASAEGRFDNEDEEDYTDYSMRRGEMGEDQVNEGASDFVGDAIEDLRASKPGLSRDQFLDELYSYIDAEYGKNAADMAFRSEDESQFDEWYASYADAQQEDAVQEAPNSTKEAERELQRYLLKDLQDKMMKLNQMYSQAKKLGNADLLTKITPVLAKLAAKKNKLAAEFNIENIENIEASVAETDSGIPVAGSIEKVQGTEVTVKNQDGTKTVAPTTMLSKDDKGNLVLNKSAVQKTATPNQSNPITPGAKVNVMSSIETESIKKLAGL